MTKHLIVAGAQRCGTTYLYHLLEQHPDICMARPVRPEPKFFLSDHAPADSESDAYVDRYFAHRRGEQVLGEKSTSYIERDDAIARIKRALPDVHLVFMLRDPALRAYSNWRFSRSFGIEPLEFRAALAAEPERIKNWDRDRFSVCPFAYEARGHYAGYLDAWLAHFPRERITVLTSESLFANPDELRPLFAKLGIDPGVSLHSHGRINAAPEGSEGLDPVVLDTLKERYRGDADRLAREWDLDVAVWLK